MIVEQADRDAVWASRRGLPVGVGSYSYGEKNAEEFRARFMAGEYDYLPIVKAFARHRTEAISSILSPENVEKAARAIQSIRGGINYDYVDFCRDAARAALEAVQKD